MSALLFVLTPDRASYRPGESVTLSLQNSAGSPLGYNLCLSQLRDLNRRLVDDGNGTFCQSIQRELPPGQVTLSTQRPLPVDLPPGRYLYVTLVQIQGAPTESVESALFDVVDESAVR